MNYRKIYVFILSSLVIISCAAASQCSSFELSGKNRKPSSDFGRYSSISALQCAIACNTDNECASYSFDGRGLCILSKDDAAGKEAEGFTFYLKKEERCGQPTVGTATTKSESGDERKRASTSEDKTTSTSTPENPASKATSFPKTAEQTKNYQLISAKKNYTEAEKACKDAKMLLVAIPDHKTSCNVEKWSKTIDKKGCTDAWIGLKLKIFDSKIGQFKWSNGDDLTLDSNKKSDSWTNWAGEKEPDEYQKGIPYGCVRIVFADLKWRDKGCDQKFCVICES